MNECPQCGHDFSDVPFGGFCPSCQWRPGDRAECVFHGTDWRLGCLPCQVAKPSPQAELKPWGSSGWSISAGIALNCNDCGLGVTLPYTDEQHDTVGITGVDDWTAPPLRCPECSVKAGIAEGSP